MPQKNGLFLWGKRFAALFEVLGILITGNVLSRILGRVIGLESAKQQLNAVPEGASPDFLNMAWLTTGDLLVKYGLLIGLAFLVGCWNRNRRLKAYGLTRGGESIAYLMGAGIVLFAAAGFLPNLLFFLNKFIPLGRGPSHWDVLTGQSSWQFWVFMAVSSFALVPVLEEIFARGYMQTRLTEDVGPGAAICITAVVFALSHSQYYISSVMSMGMLIGIILGSIFTGYVFYRTRSLLPCVIAHAIGNVPFRGWIETLVFFSMIAVLTFFRRRIWKFGRELWISIKNIDTKIAFAGIVFFLSGFFVLSLQFFPTLLPTAGIILLLLALILEFLEKKNPFPSPRIDTL